MSDVDRPSGIRLVVSEHEPASYPPAADSFPPEYASSLLAPRRRVSNGDVLERIQTLGTGSSVPSSTGAQCERMRDGLFGGAPDVIRQQAAQELRFVRGDAEGDCAIALARCSSVRWGGGLHVPALRAFARRTALPEGAVAVFVLRAFQPWATSWEKQGLAAVHAWMRTQDGTLQPPAMPEGKSTAQGFREGKGVRAERLALEILGDARLVLHAWIEKWNRPGGRRAA